MFVIPGRRVAERSGEPRIHNHRPEVMDSGSRPVGPRPE
jgi:hypothetical protein